MVSLLLNDVNIFFGLDIFLLLYLFPDSDLYFTLSVALCCFVMLLLCSALLIIFVCRQKASKGIGKIL